MMTACGAVCRIRGAGGTLRLCLPLALLAWLGGIHSAWGQATERVSVGSNGEQGNSHSWHAWISGDGRFVAFESLGSNLVANDTNDVTDIFVHDRQTRQTTRVSVTSDGAQANDDSFKPSISADGWMVTFYSEATDLVPDDTNGCWDVFVHDRLTGETHRISLDWQGQQSDNYSIHPRISADGRYVVFHSFAALVPEDNNNQWDVYAWDLHTQTIALVSVDSSGQPGNDWSEFATLSGDGRLAAYHSFATNLVPGDTNGLDDVFVYSFETATTSRVSLGYDGSEANGRSGYPSLSADGRFVAFESEAGNLVPDDANSAYDVFVHELATGLTRRASIDSAGLEGNGDSRRPFLSADGRYVTFFSHADNLIPADGNHAADIFVHDLQTGRTTRVSVDSSGCESNGFSIFPGISGDGRCVAFQSFATNLVSDDTNVAWDVFVHDRWPKALSAFAKPLR